MKTVTFDEAVYKLVPIESTREIHQAGQDSGKDLAWSYSACYRAMLAAVPDDLPGVVEHGGKPCAWLEKSAHLDAWFLAYSHNSATETKELFDHAPAQPDTAALQARIAELGTANSHLIQQARAWKHDGRCQHSIVIGTLKALGLPENDWEATGLITAKFAELKAQLAAQAGQEPAAILYVVDGQLMGSNIRDNMHLPTGNYALYPQDSAPPAPANSVAIAIAEAALEVAANKCEDLKLGDGTNHDWECGTLDCAIAIRAIDKQTILDGVEK